MDKFEAGQESARTLMGKLAVLAVFVTLMVSAIVYFNRYEPDYKRQTLVNLADQFAKSVVNAHWQWQAEGRPQIVMLKHYEPRLDNEAELIETDRRPIRMSHLGWPRTEPSSQGCEQLWGMVLNLPLEIEGFKVFAEYFDGVQQSDQALDARCRFRLSVGPYFEYHIFTGAVSQVKD
ncbi:hypothetical protein LJ739_15410 [Aestuariibacter halophilus]|uniref:MSHA biogenesis protein MshF n=1 Tax=Fluctibacter halophilus TaxID=226011 RepID=A0ABS8GEK1_9ALTE|nr:hypothetical protein [Aestuariibacter halophilus]MCC2617641.1 hypothetical protein [Aestuariibacter halophilus]